MLSLKPDGHLDRIGCEFGDGWGELECQGCTPAQIAAANNFTGCLKVLFQAGAKGYVSNSSWIGGSDFNVPFIIRRGTEYWYRGKWNHACDRACDLISIIIPMCCSRQSIANAAVHEIRSHGISKFMY